MQALRLNTLSKLTFDDAIRFDALVKDVFGRELQLTNVHFEQLGAAIKVLLQYCTIDKHNITAGVHNRAWTRRKRSTNEEMLRALRAIAATNGLRDCWTVWLGQDYALAFVESGAAEDRTTSESLHNESEKYAEAAGTKGLVYPANRIISSSSATWTWTRVSGPTVY